MNVNYERVYKADCFSSSKSNMDFVCFDCEQMHTNDTESVRFNVKHHNVCFECQL